MKNKHMHLFLVGLLFGSIVMNPVQALTDTLGIAPAQEQEAANLLSEPLNSFEKSENQEPSPDNKDVFSESEAKENLLENETGIFSLMKKMSTNSIRFSFLKILVTRFVPSKPF